jgi:hypothetical protein
MDFLDFDLFLRENSEQFLTLKQRSAAKARPSALSLGKNLHAPSGAKLLPLGAESGPIKVLFPAKVLRRLRRIFA